MKAALHGAAVAKRLIGQSRSGHWSEVDQKLVDCTYQEVADGHLIGPSTEADLDKRFGSRAWLPARRFPIEQSGKLRPIDDFSEYSNNVVLGRQKRSALKAWIL